MVVIVELENWNYWRLLVREEREIVEYRKKLSKLTENENGTQSYSPCRNEMAIWEMGRWRKRQREKGNSVGL